MNVQEQIAEMNRKRRRKARVRFWLVVVIVVGPLLGVGWVVFKGKEIVEVKRRALEGGEYEVMGLTMWLPGEPEKVESASRKLKSGEVTESWRVTVRGVSVQVTKTEIDSLLPLWARRNILDAGVKALEKARRVILEKEVSDRKVAGMEGSYMVLSYESKKQQFWHEVLIFGKKGTLWRVDVTGGGRQASTFGTEIASKVFEGIRVTE